ncbi:MAG TPA: hypothetical protein GX721_08275 [Firmicutes bacterium]|nr:hypothetical protein [Bacillota bacterium]
MNRQRVRFLTVVLVLSCMLVVGFWTSAAKVKATEEVMDSPLFAYSAELADKRLQNPYWRIESSEYETPESDSSGEKNDQVEPMATSGICPAPTTAPTCLVTCGTKPTCGLTCGSTCSSTCLVTCAATCGTKVTCADTCSATCGTKPTCGLTCGSTCAVTCGIKPTCVVTCGATCGTNPTCAATCGTNPTCAATCGTNPTCTATCSATCGTGPTCAETCSATCGATCGATCAETCGSQPTCESGCDIEHATTGTTCSPTPTCAATCSQGMSTCSATCKGYYTCVPTCGSAATCSRTCGDQPTCYLPAIACPVRPPLAPVDNGVPLTEIARFNAGAKGSKNPAWAADGSEVFFVSAGKGLKVLDAMTGDISEVTDVPSDERPEPGKNASSFAYLSKGKILFRADDKKEKAESAGSGWTVSEIEWRPDNAVLRYVARGSGGYKIGVFDPRSGSHETLYSVKSGTLLALRCPSRSYEFFALLETQSAGNKTSSVLVLSEGSTTNELFQLPGAISAIQASPDGMSIYYIMNKTVYCFDRSNGLHRILAEKAGDLLEISPCGQWLMTNPAGLAVCPSGGGRLKQIISAPGIAEFTWSIRGQIAVISHMNGHSEIWLFRVDDEVVG